MFIIQEPKTLGKHVHGSNNEISNDGFKIAFEILD